MIHVKKSKVWINFLNFSFSVCRGRKDEVKGEEGGGGWKRQGRYGGRGGVGGEESRGEEGRSSPWLGPRPWITVKTSGTKWKMRRKGLVPSRAVCVWTRKHLVSKLSVCKAFWAALATQPSGFHSLFESHEKKCFVRERKKKKKFWRGLLWDLCLLLRATERNMWHVSFEWEYDFTKKIYSTFLVIFFPPLFGDNLNATPKSYGDFVATFTFGDELSLCLRRQHTHIHI